MISYILLSCIALSDLAGQAMIDYHIESSTFKEDFPSFIIKDIGKINPSILPLSLEQERSIDGFKDRWYNLCIEDRETYIDMYINFNTVVKKEGDNHG